MHASQKLSPHKKFSLPHYEKKEDDSMLNTQGSYSKASSPQRPLTRLKKYNMLREADRAITFSINSFDKNNSTPNKEEQKKDTKQIELFDQQGDTLRNQIYGNQTLKEKQEEQNMITTAQTNNHLFSLIFLGGTTPNKNSQMLLSPQMISDDKDFKQEQKIIPDNLESEGHQGQKFHQKIKIDDFQIGKKLGTGKFGQVFLARHKQLGFFCALKKIEKSTINNRIAVQLVRQIKIQSYLSHPNIVKMYSFFSDEKNIYLVLQLCYSGQLYSYLKKKRRISENVTRNLVQQICKALDYMHSNYIIHRDLKPQNIIYQSVYASLTQGLLKICDFGWSISTDTLRGTFCGTPLYVSPQLLKRKSYNNKIDVWSIGILTYELLFGKVPFQIQNQQDFIKIVQDEIKFSKVTKVSEEAKQFILICLQKDPSDRYTVTQLLQHPFIMKQEISSMQDMY